MSRCLIGDAHLSGLDILFFTRFTWILFFCFKHCTFFLMLFGPPSLPSSTPLSPRQECVWVSVAFRKKGERRECWMVATKKVVGSYSLAATPAGVRLVRFQKTVPKQVNSPEERESLDCSGEPPRVGEDANHHTYYSCTGDFRSRGQNISLDLRENIYRVRPNGSRVASLFFLFGEGGRSVKS